MSDQRLWQTVVFQAFIDATHDLPRGAVGSQHRDKSEADAWIRGCGRNFRMVCSLAGLDPEFLSDAYRQGRVDPVRLRVSTLSTAIVAARNNGKRRAA